MRKKLIYGTAWCPMLQQMESQLTLRMLHFFLTSSFYLAMYCTI